MQSSSSSALRELCRSAVVLSHAKNEVGLELDNPRIREARRFLREREGGSASEPSQPRLGWLCEARLTLLEEVQALLIDADRHQSGAAMPLLSMSDRVTLRQLIDDVLHDLRTQTISLLRSHGKAINPQDQECQAADDVTKRLLALCVPAEQPLLSTGDGSGASATESEPSSSFRGPVHSFLTGHLRTTNALLPIFASALLLGWAQSTGPAAYAHLRRAVLLILEALPPSECFAVLGGVARLASVPSKARGRNGAQPGARVEILPEDGAIVQWPGHVLQTAQVLMGKQLAGAGGVKGLMMNVFGADLGRNEVIDSAKLDYLATLLSRTPIGIKDGVFSTSLAEQLKRIIAPPPKERALPDQYVRAACYASVKLLVDQSDGKAFAISFLASIHGAFAPDQDRRGPIEEEHEDHEIKPSVLRSSAVVTDALAILVPLLTHAPPTSPLLDIALVPILPQFVALYLGVACDRTADPLLLGNLKAILRSWGRAVDARDGAKALLRCLNSGKGWANRSSAGEETFWARDAEASAATVPYAVLHGRPQHSQVQTSQQPGGSAFRLRTRSRGPSDEDEPDLQALVDFELSPDPNAFVHLLGLLEHPELVSNFLVAVLAMYQTAVLHHRPPAETLLYLRTIMGVCETQSTSVFRDPEHMLVFVEEALRGDDEAAVMTEEFRESDPASKRHRTRDPDSDDEDAPEQMPSAVEQDPEQMGLIETAIGLFSAILAGNDSLDVNQTSLIHPIERHLRRWSQSREPIIRQSASQALMLLSVIKASKHDQSAAKSEHLSQTRQQYQEALKLLRDPLLPVRAHGLILLQDVVKAKDFERAFVPGILDVFMRSIEDDDSFMYLNAVKGLSSMVDGIGPEVFAQLVSSYVDGLASGTTPLAQDLDRRLRIGEALLQSVKRSGKAFGSYSKLVVPPLIRIFPSFRLPTVLRASALSILGACIDADWQAVLPWIDDLIGGCTDLIQLESVPIIRERKSGGTVGAEPIHANDSKHPALRRAALVFLGTVFDNAARTQEEDRVRKIAGASAELTLRGLRLEPEITTRPRPAGHDVFDPKTTSRAQTVIRYVAETDEDDLVRFQASEVLQIMDALAMVSFSLTA